MSKENISSFEQIPYGISRILNELEVIKEQLALVSKPTVQSVEPAKKILTVKDICQLLDMQKSTVYSLTHLNKIPFYKSNGRVYFDSIEIDSWIHSSRRKTIKQLQDEASFEIKR